MATPSKILFVTGRLAENSLRKTLESAGICKKFETQIQVLPISVAALMTPEWIAKHIQIDDTIGRVILPGYCHGDLATIQRMTSAAIEIGPKDVRFLPEYLGAKRAIQATLDAFEIEIIAEINHAPRQSLLEVISQAKRFAASGADVIDLGCEVDQNWVAVGDYVKALRDLGLRVSIDSLKPQEIMTATKAGAELVLSVNSSNIQFAGDFGVEVVLIPDDPSNWQRMEDHIDQLEALKVPFRVDPIIEPIGFGFGTSLHRYFQCRERWPELPMMMGIGNLTEMSEVDSAGINFLLLAVCQEFQIHSVLTTEVINWARSCVQECDIARRLVHLAISERIPPKHIDSRLVMLRDARIADDRGMVELSELASKIKDWNLRIFADHGEVHVLGSGHHLHGTDVFDLFDQLSRLNSKHLSPSHAFYLGYEMCKATIALQLGKQYSQDDALNWGFLTVTEKNRHRLSRKDERSKEMSTRPEPEET